MALPKFKIVADSSADLLTLEEISYSTVPLKIITAQKEYVDDAQLNVAEMVSDLASYHGKSSSACPSPADWYDAFDDADFVFCVPITRNLSGSYNSACIAKQDYEEDHPGRKVFVVDTLSAGSELRLIILKLKNFILSGKAFEEICHRITEYQAHTKLLFLLESMKNLANNGRVSPLVAKAAGILGIRMIGKASDQGTLEPVDKCKGERRALESIVRHMKELGHQGGLVHISHCFNEKAANLLKEMIQKEFHTSEVSIDTTRGLCSFYAESGGMIIGFETN